MRNLIVILLVFAFAGVALAGINDMGAGDGISAGSVGGGLASSSGSGGGEPAAFIELGEDELDSDFSTSSTTLVNVTGLTTTITAEEGERVLVTGSIIHFANFEDVSFSVTIDGVDPGLGGTERHNVDQTSNNFCVLSQALTAGSRVINVQVASDAQSITIDADAGDNALSWVQAIAVRGTGGALTQLGKDTLTPAQTITSGTYVDVTNLSLTVTAEEDERLLVIYQPLTAFENTTTVEWALDFKVAGSTVNRAMVYEPNDAGGNSLTSMCCVYLTEPQAAGSVTIQAQALINVGTSFQVFPSATGDRASITVYGIRSGGTGSGWSLLAEDDLVGDGDFSTSSTGAVVVTGLSDSFTANADEEVLILGNWIHRGTLGSGTNRVDPRIATVQTQDGAGQNVKQSNVDEHDLSIGVPAALTSGSKTVDVVIYVAGANTMTLESDEGNSAKSGFQVVGVR